MGKSKKTENGLESSRLTIDHDDGEKRKGASVTYMLIFACFLSTFGSSFIFGYGTGLLNSPEIIIKQFINQTYVERFNRPLTDLLLKNLWSLTVSMFLVGGMIGIFSSGYFSDKFGRRGALQFSHLFAFLAALFFGIARPSKRFELLIVGRFVLGFSAGIGGGAVPMYLTECAPTRVRGSLGVLHQLGVTIGIFVSQVLGLKEVLGGRDLWPVLLVFSAVPGFLVSFFLPFIPESPRYLLIKKKDEERAKQALRAFRGENHDITHDIEEMREEQRQLQAEPPWTMKQLLTSRQLRFPLLLLSGLQVAQQFSGINAVFYYSTSIFAQAGIPKGYTQYATLGTGVINVAMTMLSVYLMEKAGRRPLLLYGLIGMGISSALITLGLNLQKTAPGIAYLSFVCTLTFVISFAVGLGPIPLFIGGELFKQGPRPAAMSFTGMLNWLSNFVVGYTFPFIQSGLDAFSFIPFLIVVTVAAGLTFKYVQETKNKSYDEIALMYYAKSVYDPEMSNGIASDRIEMTANGGNHHVST